MEDIVLDVDMEAFASEEQALMVEAEIEGERRATQDTATCSEGDGERTVCCVNCGNRISEGTAVSGTHASPAEHRNEAQTVGLDRDVENPFSVMTRALWISLRMPSSNIVADTNDYGQLRTLYSSRCVHVHTPVE